MSIYSRALVPVALALAAVLITGSAWAQAMKPLSADDQKKAAELQERAQRIDASAAKTGTPEGQRRVTEALAKEFKVSDRTVTDLREQKKLGFGEVAITLGLARELAKRDGISVNAAIDRVVATREAGGGWGQIAHDLGLKLGRVVSEVHRTEKKVAGIERAERKPDHLGKVDKDDRPGKADRPEKMDRPDRPEKFDRPDRPERAERPGRR